MYQPTSDDVKNTLEDAVSYLKENTKEAEIAFFGGSFTAIRREYMFELLDATRPYINKFKGIRISTRPDYIDDNILSVLKEYNVTSIELGAQSLCDDVLVANNRGHNSSDVLYASKLIKEYGFSLGLQMMTGLYMSSKEKDIYTAKKIVEIKPDTVRIYPTITMKNTQLEKLYNSGDYIVQTLSDAVSLCAELLLMFEENDIRVIRLGLHHSESLIEDMIAGPYHPAFRELCESEILFNKLLLKLNGVNKDNEIEVLVSPGCVSKMIGNKKSNILRFYEMGYKIKVIQNNSVNDMDIVLKD